MASHTHTSQLPPSGCNGNRNMRFTTERIGLLNASNGMRSRQPVRAAKRDRRSRSLDNMLVGSDESVDSSDTFYNESTDSENRGRANARGDSRGWGTLPRPPKPIGGTPRATRRNVSKKCVTFSDDSDVSSDSNTPRKAFAKNTAKSSAPNERKSGVSRRIGQVIDQSASNGRTSCSSRFRDNHRSRSCDRTLETSTTPIERSPHVQTSCKVVARSRPAVTDTMTNNADSTTKITSVAERKNALQNAMRADMGGNRGNEGTSYRARGRSAVSQNDGVNSDEQRNNKIRGTQPPLTPSSQRKQMSNCGDDTSNRRNGPAIRPQCLTPRSQRKQINTTNGDGGGMSRDSDPMETTDRKPCLTPIAQRKHALRQAMLANSHVTSPQNPSAVTSYRPVRPMAGYRRHWGADTTPHCGPSLAEQAETLCAQLSPSTMLNNLHKSLSQDGLDTCVEEDEQVRPMRTNWGAAVPCRPPIVSVSSESSDPELAFSPLVVNGASVESNWRLERQEDNEAAWMPPEIESPEIIVDNATWVQPAGLMSSMVMTRGLAGNTTPRTYGGTLSPRAYASGTSHGDAARRSNRSVSPHSEVKPGDHHSVTSPTGNRVAGEKRFGNKVFGNSTLYRGDGCTRYGNVNGSTEGPSTLPRSKPRKVAPSYNNAVAPRLPSWAEDEMPRWLKNAESTHGAKSRMSEKRERRKTIGGIPTNGDDDDHIEQASCVSLAKSCEELDVWSAPNHFPFNSLGRKSKMADRARSRDAIDETDDDNDRLLPFVRSRSLRDLGKRPELKGILKSSPTQPRTTHVAGLVKSQRYRQLTAGSPDQVDPDLNRWPNVRKNKADFILHL